MTILQRATNNRKKMARPSYRSKHAARSSLLHPEDHFVFQVGRAHAHHVIRLGLVTPHLHASILVVIGRHKPFDTGALTAVRWVPIARAAGCNELDRGLEVPVVEDRVVWEDDDSVSERAGLLDLSEVAMPSLRPTHLPCDRSCRA
jgi:hypothetical protein